MGRIARFLIAICDRCALAAAVWYFPSLIDPASASGKESARAPVATYSIQVSCSDNR
jgi:hypothetical protein